MRARRVGRGLGASLAALLWSGAASADIQTFWKTMICPDFGGLKPPVAFELGHMESPADAFVGGVGGAICVTSSATLTASTPGAKTFDVMNADVMVAPGDLGMVIPGFIWDCVVCQYEDKVAAHPALSMWGTIALMGGVVTAMIFELRRRQAPPLE
jgi:hypothetical protein